MGILYEATNNGMAWHTVDHDLFNTGNRRSFVIFAFAAAVQIIRVVLP